MEKISDFWTRKWRGSIHVVLLYTLNQIKINIFSYGEPKVSSHVQKNFWGAWAFFRRRGHLIPKINVIFFVTNLMLNIFMLNNFFGKLLFSEETAKNRFLGEPILRNPSSLTFGPLIFGWEQKKSNTSIVLPAIRK